MAIKVCTQCSASKPVTEYRRRGAAFTASCRDCLRARDRAAYRTDEGRRRTVAAARETSLALLRQYMLGYLRAHPCVDCGEDDLVVLQFDHVRGVKVTELAKLRGCSLERVVAEVAKCEVRCGNCHRRKTVRDHGWWIGKAVASHRARKDTTS